MASVPEARMHAREAENRAIATAFFASVALHLLLLVAWPTLRDPLTRAEFSPGPIIARLIGPGPAAPVEVAPPQTVAPDGPKPAARNSAPLPDHASTTTAGSARGPMPPLADSAQPHPAPGVTLEPPPARQREKPEVLATSEMPTVLRPGAPLSAPERALDPSGQDAASPASAPSLIQGAPRAALAPAVRSPTPKRRAVAPAPVAPDAGTLAQYRLAVIDAAKRYKRYPRVALDNHWQGRVEVRMVIGANGAIASLELRASTGHHVLDQEALDMIRQAKPQTPIPVALRGREFAIEIPVIFSLLEPGA